MASARPPLSTPAEETSEPDPGWPRGEGEEAHRARLRRLAGMLVCRGDRVCREGDFAAAAYYFELAGAMFETIGETLRAADAVLELGRSLLFLRLDELLPALAGRLENLAREETSLPEDGVLSLRVWASILRRAEEDPTPLLHLVQERRRRRRRGSRGGASGRGAVPGDLGPIVDLRAAVRGAEKSGVGDEWPLSVDERWFVHAIEEGSAGSRIERAEQLVALGRKAGCRVRRQIEVSRVVVRIEADARGVALVAALRGEGLRAGGEPS